MLLTRSSTCFHIFLHFSTYYVYSYASTYQDKFLVCEHLLGSKTDSDSDLSLIQIVCLILVLKKKNICLFSW